MATSLESLVACGTKLWVDSVDPDAILRGISFGASGATSNPIIISDLVRTGRFKHDIAKLIKEGHDDETIAWMVTDMLVKQVQKVFEPVSKATGGDDGWVSFELDPLLEDPERKLTAQEKARRYIELGKKWGAGHTNRMIKVPATDGGLLALEEMVAAGLTLNVTLIFSDKQYITARDACWKGAQRRASTKDFKSVYSIFVSRLDVYTQKAVPTLSADAQGMVGIVNAKRIWKMNKDFWADKGLRLKQEMIFASTGAKPGTGAPPWKYVEAFAGSDIETNPPQTNTDVQESGRIFSSNVATLPSAAVLAEIDAKVDMKKLEDTLMFEGLQKFADPQKVLLKTIAEERASVKK